MLVILQLMPSSNSLVHNATLLTVSNAVLYVSQCWAYFGFIFTLLYTLDWKRKWKLINSLSLARIDRRTYYRVALYIVAPFFQNRIQQHCLIQINLTTLLTISRLLTVTSLDLLYVQLMNMISNDKYIYYRREWKKTSTTKPRQSK